MAFLRSALVPALVGSVLGGLGTLVLSIYTDLLPAILPALQTVPSTVYIKIIVLLSVIVALCAAAMIALYLRTRIYRPRALRGTAFGYEWSAELDYRSGKREEVDIEIQFICPQHKVFLGVVDANVPDCNYHNLWCRKCNITYQMQSGGGTVYVSEAKHIIRRDILSRLRLDKASQR